MRIVVRWLMLVTALMVLAACDSGTPAPDANQQEEQVQTDATAPDGSTSEVTSAPPTDAPEPTPARTAAPTATPYFGRDIVAGRSTATLRVIHAAYGVPTLDVRLNNVSVAASLGYGLGSGLTAILPGTYRLSVFQRGAEILLVETDVTLTPSVTTDVIITPGDGAPQILVVNGPSESTESGTGIIQAVNAVSGTNPLTFKLDGRTVTTALGVGQATDLNRMPEGDIDAVFSAGSTEILSNRVRLRELTGMLLVLAGESTRPHLLAFEAPLLGRYSLRVINLSTDAREIDIYFDKALIAGNLAADAVTDRATYSTAATNLSVYSAFADLNVSIPHLSNERLTPAPDSTVTLAIYGPVSALRAMWIEQDMSPVPANYARITFANVLPEASTVRMAIDGAAMPNLRAFNYGTHSENILQRSEPFYYTVLDGRDSNNALERHDALMFEAGRSHIFFVTGTLDSAVVVSDPLTVDSTLSVEPGATPVGEYHARYVNAIASQATIDVLINGNLATRDLRYGTTSESARTPANAYRVLVRNAGTGGQVLLDTEIVLPVSASYTIFISGNADYGYLATPIEDRGLASGASAGTARFVNLTPDQFQRFGVAAILSRTNAGEQPTNTPVPTATAVGNTAIAAALQRLPSGTNLVYREIGALQASRATGIIANSILYIVNDNQEIIAAITQPQAFAPGTHTDIVYYQYPSGMTQTGNAFTIVYP